MRWAHGALAGVFEDGKAWVDQVPVPDSAGIRDDYAKAPVMDNAALRRFVTTNFASEPIPPAVAAPRGRAPLDHIEDLWPRPFQSNAPAASGVG